MKQPTDDDIIFYFRRNWMGFANKQPMAIIIRKLYGVLHGTTREYADAVRLLRSRIAIINAGQQLICELNRFGTSELWMIEEENE